MASRTPSAQSRADLAALLLDAGLGRAGLVAAVQALGHKRLAWELPQTGVPADDVLRGVELLANRGVLDLALLFELETAAPERADDFARLRVAMELAAPSSPLLGRAELDALKRAARAGGLHDGVAHARLAARLPPGLRANASTSLAKDEQLLAWFDAANRQPLGPGDRAWMLPLLEAAAELAAPGAAGRAAQADLRAALARLRLAEPGDPRDARLGDADRGALQQIVQAYGIMLGAGDFLDAVAASLARTCLVEVPGVGQGTGFLVGDDLALTAYHVLSPVIGGAVDPALVELRFDYRYKGGVPVRDGPAVRLATAGRSPANPRPWLVDASPPTPDEEREVFPPDLAAPTSEAELDFALVRLAEAVGRAPAPGLAVRGAFDVAGGRAAFDFPKGTALMIVGHPVKEGSDEALPQVFSIAPDAVVERSPNLTRVRYRTNTRSGSSGSPVLTCDGRVVALHQAGTPAANQGVPLAAIVARPAVAAALAAKAG